jgi:3-oxoacyl-[acyl-carrier-protein] synthase II
LVFLRSMACITVHGEGEAPLAAALGRGAACPMRPSPLEAPARPEAVCEAGWIHPIPRPARWIGKPPRFARLDRLAQLALSTAHLAAARAGLEAPPAISERSSVMLGTAFGSHLSNELFAREIDATPRGEDVAPGVFPYTLPSSAAAEIAIQLGLGGPSLTLTLGDGSGLAALAAAAGAIDRGECDRALAGGAEVLSPTLLAAEGATVPALAARSEGAAFFLLEREPSGRAGALARFGGHAKASGSGALDRARAEALDRSALGADLLEGELLLVEAIGLTPSPPASAPPRAGAEPLTPARLEATAGRCGATLALLGAVLLVEGGRLPALVAVLDPAGNADALCLLPGGGEVPR